MAFLVWATASAVALAFAVAVVAAPLALEGGHDTAALVIYRSFAKFCNQMPGRSFHVAGHPFAVCARCTGIYFGFAATLLAYPLLRPLGAAATAPARKWLLLALGPAAADFALGFFGLWENTHLTRAITGALLGSVAALYVVPGLLDMCGVISEQRRARRAAGVDVTHAHIAGATEPYE